MITARSFTNISQLENGKTVFDLPIMYSGTLEGCHNYCKMFAGYEWQKDESIFGGYYSGENGDCLLIV